MKLDDMKLFIRGSVFLGILFRYSYSAIILLCVSIGNAFAGGEIKLYETHCARCHGVDRLGLIGPALMPGNLQRL